jgi:hypothetical protein
MSQFILDEQLDLQVVLPPLRRWTSVILLRDLRPGEVILDDRVAEILLEVVKPTFVTIDRDFWDRRLCHPDYCILCFDLRDDQQNLLPRWLRALVQQKGFDTRAARMGKVARVGPKRIDFFEHLAAHVKHLDWPTHRRKRRTK